jgi:uncharacterized membrane protein YeiB
VTSSPPDTSEENMRDRITKGMIVLAVLLLAGDLLWVLSRLAPILLAAVRRAPEALLLAGALLLLIAAQVVRSARSQGPLE